VLPNSAIRREHVNSFDKRKYGRRKPAEMVFGNITKRRTRSLILQVQREQDQGNNAHSNTA
jgi:hypothetical protein